MKFANYLLRVFLLVHSVTFGVPVENEELMRSELESQEVSYEGGGIRNNESELRGSRNNGGSSGIPLQRAITYTNPVVPLEFQEKARKKPRRKNLKPARLLRKMGEDFDPLFMSIENPVKTQSEVAIQMGENQLATLIEQVSGLNLEEEFAEIASGGESVNVVEEEEEADEDDTETEPRSSLVTPEALAVFRQWLIRKSSCPVIFEWHDLGSYFWPRYIKRGRCNNAVDGGGQDRGCSWPKGMHCVSGESKTLHILRWHCRAARRKSKSGGETSSSFHYGALASSGSRPAHKCRWYKVPYPVTSGCKCACKNGN